MQSREAHKVQTEDGLVTYVNAPGGLVLDVPNWLEEMGRGRAAVSSQTERHSQARERYEQALMIDKQLDEGLYRPHIERALAETLATVVSPE